MHGNVKEWCYDFYGDYPTGETLLDPIGPIRGVKRVIRGGSFLRAAQAARSACRESLEPSWRGSEIGFPCRSSVTLSGKIACQAIRKANLLGKVIEFWLKRAGQKS